MTCEARAVVQQFLVFNLLALTWLELGLLFLLDSLVGLLVLLCLPTLFDLLDLLGLRVGLLILLGLLACLFAF